MSYVVTWLKQVLTTAPTHVPSDSDMGSLQKDIWEN